ncbi:MAG: cell division protein FtsQ/DivIB [Candidatus Omnitrophica bacterium]|nr:cell division protein FtsQ/DivIB [Candidatus Omnitrophota bacterium]MBU1038606.1 cell division protein FtsQ/DivIB [Candidatus Omnitrophota bacterium]MBU1809206.1 cell division protein FtsQ/DivIB [Candidatus Omnitrophota bacterium]
MRRLKRIKRPKTSRAGAGIKDFIVSKATTVVVVFVFLIFAAILFKAFLHESGYFKLRAVDVKASFLDARAASSISNRILNTYRSRNIFSVNLKHIAQYIQNSYGDVRDVAVRMSLPDKLIVSLKLRRPVALVKSGKYYPVDEDGVVLPVGSRVNALDDLPIINGLDIRTVNARHTNRNLKLALKLLEEIRLTRSLSSLGVTAINVYDPRNMSFNLKNGVEIRVGEEKFRERLDLLSKALRDPRLAMDNITYIDVRFKDIIVGPK